MRTKLMAPENDLAGSGVGVAVTDTAPATAPARPAIDPAVLAEVARTVRDSVFADLRRSGQLKANPKAASAAPEETPAAAPSLDLGKLRSLDRALTRSGLGQRLSDRQMQRAEEAFLRESPDDAAAWVAEYFDGMSPGATAAPTPAPQPSNATPVSNGGAPQTPRVPVEEQDLISMSKSDIDHLRKTKGDRWVTETFKKQMQGRRISLR